MEEQIYQISLSSFVFQREKKKILQVWNDMRGSRWQGK